MGDSILGATEHLLFLLERDFSVRGAPPEPQSWRFSVPDERGDGLDALPEYDTFGKLAGPSSCPLAQEAVANLQQLRGVSEAIEVIRELVLAARPSPGVRHFQFVFKRFLDQRWARGTSRISEGPPDGDGRKHYFGYTLRLPEPSVLANLRDAARWTEDIGQKMAAKRRITRMSATFAKS